MSTNNTSKEAKVTASTKTSTSTTKKAATSAEKSTTTAKKPSVSKEMQSLWQNYQKEKGQDAVTEEELLKSIDKSNYKGIHDVVDHSTWISPHGLWAMKIPAGFSYTMDYTETAMIQLMLNYSANVQLTGNVDFAHPKPDPFTMGIAPVLGLLKSDDACQDLLSDKATEAIVNFKDGIPGDVSVLKLTSDIVVLFQSWEDTVDRKKVNKVLFFVICSGSTLVTGGEMAMAKSAGESLTSLANAMLESIVKVPQRLRKDGFIPTVLPKEFTLSFNKGTVIRTDDGLTIPVPDGFKGSTNEREIGQRAFSIVPEDMKYWNGTGDQSYLPLDISMMKIQSNALPTSVNMAGKVVQTIAEKLEQQGAFDTKKPFYLARLTDNGSYFMQQFTDYGDTSWNMIRVLQISDTGVKIYTVRMNFHKKIQTNYFDLLLHEVRMFATTWINHLPLDGEVLYDHGLFTIKPVTALDETAHEHLDIVNSGKYTTHRDADFRAQPIRRLMENEGNRNEKAYSMMQISGDNYSLDKDAIRFAEVFRLSPDQFDTRRDTEALIRLGMFENVRSYHALRSLAWNVGAMADKKNKKPEQFSFNELNDIGNSIEKANWLSYSNSPYYQALCDQYDWHVFYVPNQYIQSDEADHTDLRALCGKENRGGNTISFAMFGLGIDTFSETNRINKLIGRNEETLASLEDLRKDLADLLPVMKTIYDGFMKNRDRKKKLEGALAEALTAWCALSIAATEPFYTEEAADTPEANAALRGQLKRPDGSIQSDTGEDYKKLYDYGKEETISRFGSFTTENEPQRGFEDYRAEMETACKEGKTLQEMIEKGRDAVSSSFMGDMGAFEQAVENLDRTADITFAGKHFVLTGFGDFEDGVISEIEKRGGIVHSHMVKLADYLVVCLESPGASKVKGALDWRKKGASNQIVSDYQMWQAMLGNKSSSTKSTPKKQSTTQQTKTTTARSKTKQATKMTELEDAIGSTASELSKASTSAMTTEEKKAIQEAQGILKNMQSDMDSTKSALEKHAENLRKQEEEKEKRMAEAKAKGKSDKDEADMLAVLLIEEDQGNLKRTDDDFAETFAEDFGAYDSKQIIQLRKKVRPKMHDAAFQESAKEELLSRPVKDRFSISTANWFNLSNLWDFDEKGSLAIEKTKQYYRDSEMREVRDLMAKHKQAGIDSVNSQLTSFNSTWTSFMGVRNDLHICIGSCEEPIPDSRKVFDVMIDGTNHAYIQLQHPSMGFLTIPIMNLFASVWKTTPERIWDAALNNEINDSRGVYGRSRSDAISAKDKALAAIKPQKTQPRQTTTTPARNTQASQTIAKPVAGASSHNDTKIRELQGRIASLKRELDSIKGIFGFVKRNKIKKEINDLENELNMLKK